MDNFDEKPFGALLAALKKNQHKFLNDRLKKDDLTTMQAVFLIKIYIHDCCSQKDLADYFYVNKGTVAKYLRDLEVKGFVTRERVPENRRQYKLKCTEKAIDIMATFKEINEEWEQKVGLNELGSDFVEKFRKLTVNSVKLNEEESRSSRVV